MINMIDKSSFKAFFILCVYVFDLNVCMCVTCVCVVPVVDRRGVLGLLELVMDGGKLPYVYFGNHTQFSARVVSTLNHCTISSASCKKTLNFSDTIRS